MLGGLGAVGDTAQVLIQSGWDSTLINGLVQAGASDQQLTDLLNGATDPTTILTQLKASQSGGINPTIAPPPPPTSSPIPILTTPGTVNYAIPAVQVPAGSVLSYTASWNNPSALANTYSGVVPKLVSQLPSNGISVLQTNVTGYGLLGPSSIQLQLQSNGAHAQISDVTSIVNSLLQALVGNTLFQSSPQMSLISAGPVPGGSGGSGGAPQSQSMTAWFEQNAPIIGLGFAALFILGIVFEKKV